MLTRRMSRSSLSLALPRWHRAAASRRSKLKVVATFSILADFVKNVGGERVEVAALVGPNGDAHVYSPSPGDAKTLADAKVVFVNGLGFEGWIDAAGQGLRHQGADRSSRPRASSRARPEQHAHGHGDADPHAWQIVANAKIYVANIRDALIAADPAGKAAYEANAAAYLGKLDALDAEVRAAIDKIPADRRRIITTHDAFGYFAAAYGVDVHRAAGRLDRGRGLGQGRRADHPADPEAEDPGGVPGERHRPAAAASASRARAARKIGGTLYSDALTDAEGPGGDLHRHDAAQRKAARARR